MSLYAFSLVFVAALLHATWNLYAKRSGGAVKFAFQTAVATTLLWAPLNAWLTVANPTDAIDSWDMRAWAAVYASAVAHAFYFVVLFQGYRLAPLSVVYPVARGTAPLISSIAAVLLFDEKLTFASIVGIGFIVVGVVLLSWKGRRQDQSEALGSGIFWGALSGLTISLYTIIDAFAVKSLNLNPIFYDYWVQVLRAVVLLPFVGNPIRAVRAMGPETQRAALVVALFSPAAYILVLFAMQLAPVSHVAPAREVSMLFGALFGGMVLREGHMMRRFIAAMLIAIGVIALVAG